MKKLLCIMATALLLTACSANSQAIEPAATDAVPETTMATEAETVASPQTLPLPDETMEFSFLTGAGGWRSNMTLNRDGSFTGMYTDSEMGEVGDGYPYGSVYVCVFSGKFENIAKVDEYSYKMTLPYIETEKPIGEEWIEDEIRYIASGPFGLNDTINNQECTDFVFYLPNMPVDQLSEDFLFWWPYQFSEEAKTTLSCYGILNVTTNNGFFSAES